MQRDSWPIGRSRWRVGRRWPASFIGRWWGVSILRKPGRIDGSRGTMPMNDERRIDPQHKRIRAVLRVVGPLTLGVGLVFVVVGVTSFFRSFGSFGPPGSFAPPRYFWCAFVGFPLMGLGSALTQYGYLGAVGRYIMGEMAPVQKDAFNVVAHGARPGVESLARAIGRGFASAGGSKTNQGPRCPGCDAPRNASARFCGRCGAGFGEKVCPGCGRGNAAEDNFCGQCGERLG